MTDSELGFEPNSAPSKQAGLGKRIVEWFWRGAALASWNRALQVSYGDARELETRARLTADLALVAWTAESPFGEAVACELYREAAYWSLCALTPSSARPDPIAYTEAVWAGLEPSSLELLAKTAVGREALIERLRTATFVTFGELAPSERTQTREAFRELTSALLARLNQSRAGQRKLLAQRYWRLGGLALLPLLAVLGWSSLSTRLSQHGDRAAGAPWRTSSAYGSGGCTSPDQTCDGMEGWFFHTAEGDPDPWIEFDLEGSKSVSSVVVDNRSDCCPERAVPLLVELSDDQRHWRRVAERREPFETWQAQFPATSAAFVRLRVPHTVAFHLRRVRILP